MASRKSFTPLNFQYCSWAWDPTANPNSKMNYPCKTIKFRRKPITILQQDVNGPCPIIAIANCLALSQSLILPPTVPHLSHDHLVEILTDVIFAKAPDDPISIIQGITDLDKGCLITPRFTGEMFCERDVVRLFGVFGIKLCHGWLVDPQDIETTRVINQYPGIICWPFGFLYIDYNSLVDLSVR